MTSHFIHQLVLHEIRGGFSFIRNQQSYLPFLHWTGWSRFRRFVMNEYWTRIWIVQEFVLARKVTIMYGNVLIPWPCIHIVSSIKDWTIIMNAETDDSAQDMSLERNFSQMADLRADRESFPMSDSVLPGLVSMFRSFHASLPQDKIYGLLGLVENAGGSGDGIVPDYTKKPTEVYTDLVELALRRGAFSILSSAGLSHPRSDVDLPSWVPCLSCPPAASNERWYRHYQCGGPPSQASYEILDDRRRLRIRGHVIGAVKACTDEPPISSRDLDAKHGNVMTIGWAMDRARITAFFLSCVEVLVADAGVPDPYTPHQGGQPLAEAMWRTLIQDYDEEVFPAKLQSVDYVANRISTIQKIVREEKEPFDSVKLMDRLNSSHGNSIASLISGDKGPARNVAAYFPDVALRYRFAISEEGYMALVPLGTLPGDVLCAIKGCPVPVVLRRTAEEYLYWGDAFVHGVMSGEAAKGEGIWLTIR
jgi:hypothetical protein